MKRIFYIVLPVVLIGLLVWIAFFRSKGEEGTQTQTSSGIFQTIFSKRTDNVPTDTSDETFGAVIPIPVLAQTSHFTPISLFPVAGYVAFDVTRTVTIPAADPKQKPTTEIITDHIVRYLARANGYVYESKNGGAPTQISNTYIPNVYEAVFTPDGKTVIARFLRDDGRTIATHSIPIPEQNLDGSRTQQPGIYFSENLNSIALSADGKTVLQIAPATNGGVSVITSDVKNANRKELLSHPFTGWLPFLSGTSSYLQTKASGYAPGFLYKIDTANKQLTKVLGDIVGLTTSISPKNTFVLYSESQGDSFKTSLFTQKTGVSRPLGLSILPEKCSWLANENAICAGGTTPPAPYPDGWYAGTVNFFDKLYMIYTTTGGYDTLDEGQEWQYDATALQAVESQRFLYFIDKPTGLLWQFKY